MNDSYKDYDGEYGGEPEPEVVATCDYNEMEGNLITLAKEGMFDVIAHGCNIHNTMGAGIAPQMAKAFRCDEFEMETEVYKNDFNKLGQIDWEVVNRETGDRNVANDPDINCDLAVVNCYTQTLFGLNHKGGVAIPLDYEALTLCMRKLNHDFKGKHMGLPLIGCGLAGGLWERVREIIKQELCDCKVTIIIYKG